MPSGAGVVAAPGSSLSSVVQSGFFALDSHASIPVPPVEPSIWDDSLMWELFNIQPSIEWFG